MQIDAFIPGLKSRGFPLIVLRYLAGRLAGETDMQVSPRVAFMNLAQNFSTALIDPHPEFHLGYIDAVTELFFEQRQTQVFRRPLSTGQEVSIRD